jgi:endonuclease/exonuclease/phosphatase (EEP) superfamily protein YafD
LSVIGWRTLPAVRTSSDTPFAPTAPRIRVFTSNLFVSNNRYDEMVDTIMHSDADVVVLVELTPWFVEKLRARSVLDRYPNQMLDAQAGAGGSGILSRLPIDTAVMREIGGYNAPSVRLLVDGRPITIVAAHPFPPSSNNGPAPWVRYLNGVRALGVSATEPVVIAGDFNATRWHRQFINVLTDGPSGGLRDAHEAAGKGLTMSWPTKWLPFRVMRLDHLLMTRDVRVVHVENVDMPGSDHTGFLAEIAIGASSADATAPLPR